MCVFSEVREHFVLRYRVWHDALLSRPGSWRLCGVTQFVSVSPQGAPPEEGTLVEAPPMVDNHLLDSDGSPACTMPYAGQPRTPLPERSFAAGCVGSNPTSCTALLVPLFCFWRVRRVRMVLGGIQEPLHV